MIVERKCIVTGKVMDRKLLYRIVLTPEGSVKVDLTNRANGRGAYITRSKEVILEAQKRKVLNRALKVNVDDEIYQTLLNMVGNE